jgi:predicted nucleotide-binding protein (sugar kinase/HSP70/actin superfamily)
LGKKKGKNKHVKKKQKQKKKKKKPAATVNIPRVLEYFIIYIYSFHAY